LKGYGYSLFLTLTVVLSFKFKTLSELKEVRTKFSPAKIKEILGDFRLAVESREASLLGRKEVFMGKAKFGIFGDGKELAQIAMAKVFQKGDFRAGYYTTSRQIFHPLPDKCPGC